MVYLTCAVTGLGGRGGNKQVLKRHQSAYFLCCHVDITSLVKAHLSYRSMQGGKLISVSVAWKTKVYWYIAALLPPSPTPSFPLPNRVTPSSVVCRRYPYMHLYRVKRVKVLV